MRFLFLIIFLPFYLQAQPGQKTEAQPGQKTEAQPGQKTEAQPVNRAEAQPSPKSANQNSSTLTPMTLNQILFSEGDASWTSRDFQLYKKLVQTVVKKQRLALHTDSDMEDFIASRLLLREAEQFDLRPIKLEYQYQAKAEFSDYSKAEVNNEIKNISLAMSLLELKEKQMSQKARFQAWVDVLKRKYAMKIKAQDVVPAG